MFTPISRMSERYRLEKDESDVSAFHALLFFGELITKATVSSLLSGVADDRDRSRYSIERDLVRADGIGEWANALDTILTGPCAQYLNANFQDLLRDVSQRVSPDAWQYETVKLLHETLVALQIDVEKLPGTASLRQWFKWFALLRNKTRGHGATLAFECASVVPSLERSILLIADNLCAFQWNWAYLHRNLSGKYRVTSLGGDSDLFSYLKQSKTEVLPNGVYVFRGSPVLVTLAASDPDSSDFFFPNGQFRGSDFESISYISNQKRRIDGRQWLTPGSVLPDSETHGDHILDVQGGTLSNVPQLSGDYVERPKLEESLESALNHMRHEIVTLSGPGGIGKTSLALSVIKKLQLAQPLRFEVIVWFSARDIDLLPSGPKAVRPKGVSLRDFADEYVELLSPNDIKTKGFSAEHFFGNALSTAPVGPALFVFDNFETVVSQRETFTWIDTYIRPPNKVLITTRTRDFVGDFPIEVLGMTEPESRQLIDSTASRLGISELITKEYRQILIDESSGHPYVIKILLGEVYKAKKLCKPERIISDQEHILQALFERTFNVLSPAAQRVFLLLSSWRSVVAAIAVEAVVLRSAENRLDVREAIDELKRLSFLEELESESGTQESFLFLPLAALTFGAKKLNASPLKAVIAADSELLREFGAIGRSGVSSGVKVRLSQLVKGLARRISSGQEDIRSLRPMLEFLATRVPALWFDISQLYIEEGDVSGLDWAKDALRRLIESGDRTVSPDDVWRKIAHLCKVTNDLQGEMHALAELADANGITTEELSALADSMNRVFSQAKKIGAALFQPEERKHIVGKIISQFEARLDQLDPTDLSRCAWLHMHVNDEVRALALARKGLAIDPDHPHCTRLDEKLANKQVDHFESTKRSLQ